MKVRVPNYVKVVLWIIFSLLAFTGISALLNAASTVANIAGLLCILLYMVITLETKLSMSILLSFRQLIIQHSLSMQRMVHSLP